MPTFRARPVVNLETELRFVTPVPGKIDLNAADCVTEKGDQVRVVIMKMMMMMVMMMLSARKDCVTEKEDQVI